MLSPSVRIICNWPATPLDTLLMLLALCVAPHQYASVESHLSLRALFATLARQVDAAGVGALYDDTPGWLPRVIRRKQKLIAGEESDNDASKDYDSDNKPRPVSHSDDDSDDGHGRGLFW